MAFRKITLIALAMVYLVVLAGGIVRSTGAGMGCPDWPRCFGTWVPPTKLEELPINYQEIYGSKLKGEVIFNVVKTWTEYINRLLGVVTGFAIFGVLLASFSFLKKDKKIFYISLLAFLMVAFQGWLGSKVVSSELMPVMITLHMVVAILIVFMLLFVYECSGGQKNEVTNNRFNTILIVCTISLSIIQIIFGTQVREGIDVVSKLLGENNRSLWVDNLNWTFLVHRSFSLLLLVMNSWLAIRLQRQPLEKHKLNPLIVFILLGILSEILSGVVLSYAGMPAFAQPIHLTLAVMIISCQFLLWLRVQNNIEIITRF